jgi:hypothetical protein
MLFSHLTTFNKHILILSTRFSGVRERCLSCEVCDLFETVTYPNVAVKMQDSSGLRVPEEAEAARAGKGVGEKVTLKL